MRYIREYQQAQPDMEKIRAVAGNPELAEAQVCDFGTFCICHSGLNRNDSDITPEGQRAAVGQWIGKAILLDDHKLKTSNQIGRVYDAWIEDRPDATYTMGRGFGVRTADHADVFARIENHVHREMSCAYEPIRSVCSACGTELAGPQRMTCQNGHGIGRDAYARDLEFVPDHVSFVGYPGVPGAGLVLDGAVNLDTLRTYSPELARDAEDGREFRSWAEGEFAKYLRLNGMTAADATSLIKRLSAREMIHLGRIEKSKFEKVIPDGRQQAEAAPITEPEPPPPTTAKDIAAKLRKESNYVTH
jgi:hypothetical protein